MMKNFDDCPNEIKPIAFANATKSAMRARGANSDAKGKHPDGL